MKIRLVTDGTCDLPPEMAEKLGIEIVDVHVTTEEGEPILLKGETFYEFLRTTKKRLFTSQPSVGQFVETYKKLASFCSSIISIHLTAARSGTFRSAEMAKNSLPELDITVIDSKITSLGLGLLVLEARKLIDRGRSKLEVIDAILSIIPKIKSVVPLETLEFALKGGRIDGLKLLVGTLLNLKPILSFQDGVPKVREVMRGRLKSLERSFDIFKGELEAALKEGQEIAVGIAHADTPEIVADIKNKLLSLVPSLKIIDVCAGPVLGTHAGPGAIGLFLVPGAHT